ncbi:MAG: VanZ family protein [Bacteroidetes bacterium]|nr:VanZ family protein [Bacteroidota bacterium]
MKENSRSLKFKRAITIGYFVLILVGSSVPGNEIPEIFNLTPDKLLHCLEYSGLGLLLSFWLSDEFHLRPSKQTALGVLVLGALAGMTDELFQNLIPNRTPDFYDWCLDFVGINLGLIIFPLWKKKSRP